MIIYRKKLKWQGKLWNIKVATYPSKKLCLYLINNTTSIQITIDLSDAYLEKGHLFLDPATKDNGILQLLKKSRIIRTVTGLANYNYVFVPIVLVNMGILKKYDSRGVTEHLNIVNRGEYQSKD